MGAVCAATAGIAKWWGGLCPQNCQPRGRAPEVQLGGDRAPSCCKASRPRITMARCCALRQCEGVPNPSQALPSHAAQQPQTPVGRAGRHPGPQHRPASPERPSVSHVADGGVGPGRVVGLAEALQHLKLTEVHPSGRSVPKVDLRKARTQPSRLKTPCFQELWQQPQLPVRSRLDREALPPERYSRAFFNAWLFCNGVQAWRQLAQARWPLLSEAPPTCAAGSEGDSSVPAASTSSALKLGMR